MTRGERSILIEVQGWAGQESPHQGGGIELMSHGVSQVEEGEKIFLDGSLEVRKRVGIRVAVSSQV